MKIYEFIKKFFKKINKLINKQKMNEENEGSFSLVVNKSIIIIFSFFLNKKNSFGHHVRQRWSHFNYNINQLVILYYII